MIAIYVKYNNGIQKLWKMYLQKIKLIWLNLTGFIFL
jgi:hypothetical protein